MAYNMVEPFGESRADQRASVVAHTIATAMLKKKSGQPFRLEDFGLVGSGEAAKPRWKDWRQAKAAMQAALCRPKGA